MTLPDNDRTSTPMYIYFLEGSDRFKRSLQDLFSAIDRRDLAAVTSQLTLAEVLVKPIRDNNASLQDRCREFIRTQRGLMVRPVDEEVAVIAARIRAVHGFRMPDAIHAATAATGGCQVVVTNDRRLRSLDGVRVLLLDDHADAG